MKLNFGHCKTCEVLEEQNKYLRGIIDRLLVKNGVTPLKEPEPEIEIEEEPEEKYGE
jgi:hypothetical protein